MRALLAITLFFLFAYISALTLETYSVYESGCNGRASEWTVFTGQPDTCVQMSKDVSVKYSCNNGTIEILYFIDTPTCGETYGIKAVYEEGQCNCNYRNSIAGCQIARCTDPEIPKEARITTQYKDNSCDETKKYPVFKAKIHDCNLMYGGLKNGTFGTWSCKDNVRKQACNSNTCNECEEEFSLRRGECVYDKFNDESYKETCKGYDAASSLSSNLLLVLGMLVLAFIGY